MKQIFQIGDKVILKQNLKINKKYNQIILLANMCNDYKGKILVVKNISNSKTIITIKGNPYSWGVDMFDLYPANNNNNYEIF